VEELTLTVGLACMPSGSPQRLRLRFGLLDYKAITQRSHSELNRMAASRVFIRLALSLFAVAAFSAMANVPREGTDPPPSVGVCTDWMAERSSTDGADMRLIGDNTLCADIPVLSEKAVEEFVKQVDLLPNNAQLEVVIRSAGGRVDLGMTMGEAIQRRQTTVYVSGFCGSSCANYVFLPAKRRVILKDSLLVFHGGLYRAMIAEPSLTDEGKSTVKASLSRQGRLLHKAGVDVEFFERIEQLNDDSEQVPEQCGGTKSVRSIVFSARELTALGAVIDQDYGPKTKAEVDALTKKYGIYGDTCYWH